MNCLGVWFAEFLDPGVLLVLLKLLFCGLAPSTDRVDLLDGQTGTVLGVTTGIAHG